MDQVGYDTYCNLLNEVVSEIQGKEIKKEIEVQIDLDVTSYIPDSYISDSSQKIEIYQDIALCRTEEDIQNVIDEVIDRFGDMPSELENLIEIARIKSLCKQKFVSKISSKKGFAVFTFENESFEVDVNQLLKTYKNRLRFSPGLKPIITLALNHNEYIKILKEIKEFLENL